MGNVNDYIGEAELAALAARVRSSTWVPAPLWDDALQVAAEAICRVAAKDSWRPEIQTMRLDFEAWAYIKARYALLSWVRAQTSHSPSLPLMEQFTSIPAPDEMDAVIIRSDLAGALRSLDPIDREILVMDALGYRRATMSHRFAMNGVQLAARIASARCAVRDLLVECLPSHVENESK